MSETKVYKYVLENGLTVLTRPSHHIPRVSTQLWYNVGSKDEKTGEKGLAHLIEHMIFKGTKSLTESDINMITHKLSGSCNAFTSHDYTGYLFDFPSHHWQEALPIMADCMKNCTFKQELLNSELKAIIQELKMYKDSYVSSLAEEMTGALFSDHPYHYPIIGHKHDLWNLTRESILNFYQKHYVPNNAVLVVVGDVLPSDVLKQAEKYFGSIKSDKSHKKEGHHLTKDLISKSVTIYRDIQVPVALFAFVVPGAKKQYDFALDALSLILGSGKSSRLYKKLVDQNNLATDVDVFSYDLFDYSLLFVYVQPRYSTDIEKIANLVNEEISSLKEAGFRPGELESATKRTKAHLLSVLENIQKQAYLIGKSFLATGDPEYLFNYMDAPLQDLRTKINQVLECYLLPSLLNYGAVLPVGQQDKEYWKKIQKLSDEEDARVLLGRERSVGVEKGKQVENVAVKQSKTFDFPKATTIKLSNGLVVNYYNNKNLPKINMTLDLQAKYYYDPENQQGLYNFMCEMMTEGSKKYPASALAEIVESNGMGLEIQPGQISLSCLKNDFFKALDIFNDVIIFPEFRKTMLKKVQRKTLTDINNFWDEPTQFFMQLLKEQIYKGHPYSKNALGSKDSVKNFSVEDLHQFHKKVISPSGSILSIVGDLEGIEIEALVEKFFSCWSGPEVRELEFPELFCQTPEELKYYINRDQVVLSFGRLSISRLNPDFDKLLLFDQVFSGGVLGSMSSRLFQLREQSGLFYTIAGSLLASSGKQPGMAVIKTLVSLDRLEEAKAAIKSEINISADSLSGQELEQAQNAIASSLVGNFASNRGIASSFIFLNRYALPSDYFDNRAEQLRKISIVEIQDAAKKILNANQMYSLAVGRV